MQSGFLVSFEFWTWFAFFALVTRAVVWEVPIRARTFLVLLSSGLFLLSFDTITPALLLTLTLSLAAIFVVASRTLPSQERRRRGLWLALGILVLFWALGKVGQSLDSPFSHLFFLGASFLVIKIWSFCKDLYDGRIERPELFTFLAYCLFFPCFISGPMHYYGEFRTALETRLRLDPAATLETVFRLVQGLVKVLVVARLLRPFALEGLVAAGLSTTGPGELLTRSLVYSLFIYVDFSGYSDIAISAGRLLGIAVPENFNLPYLASSLRGFWQRWHITFTRFLTQYIFVPFTRYLSRDPKSLSVQTMATFGYLVTFSFCGFWHGSTLNFLLWGLYHGAGLAAYDWYRRKRGLASAGGLSHGWKNTFIHFASTAGTFLFVSIGWTLFVLPMSFWRS